MPLTQRQALKIIRRELMLTANVVDREYRVNYRQYDARHKGTASAYYTHDPVDAVGTAREMAKTKIVTVGTV